MDLYSLDDLIPSLGIDPTEEHLKELYEIFKKDFIEEDYFLNGLRIKIDLAPSKEDGFENYPHTFVKLITRGKKNNRVFDRKRANKLHWIKIILDNRESDDITCFKYKEGSGSVREYFWFKEGDYLVIMEKITPDYIIISGFHIDDERNRRFYQRRYEESRK